VTDLDKLPTFAPRTMLTYSKILRLCIARTQVRGFVPIYIGTPSARLI